jgi:hypothetical protein
MGRSQKHNKTGISTSAAHRYEELIGGREEQAMQIARAAMEAYFLQCRENNEEVRYRALRGAVLEAGEAAFHRSRNPGSPSLRLSLTPSTHAARRKVKLTHRPSSNGRLVRAWRITGCGSCQRLSERYWKC